MWCDIKCSSLGLENIYLWVLRRACEACVDTEVLHGHSPELEGQKRRIERVAVLTSSVLRSSGLYATDRLNRGIQR